MKNKHPLSLGVLLMLLVWGCGRNAAPQQMSRHEPIIADRIRDTVSIRDTLYDIQGGEAFYEYTRIDSLYFKNDCPKAERCPPCQPTTVINTRRNKDKIKNSYNYIGEINELKRSNQIKDSQIDSLNMQLGKKCTGNQTNNGSKWWVFVLLGMGIGVTGYQAIRSAITKKI